MKSRIAERKNTRGMKRNKIKIKKESPVCVCLWEYIAMVMGAGEHSPGQNIVNKIISQLYCLIAVYSNIVPIVSR